MWIFESVSTICVKHTYSGVYYMSVILDVIAFIKVCKGTLWRTERATMRALRAIGHSVPLMRFRIFNGFGNGIGKQLVKNCKKNLTNQIPRAIKSNKSGQMPINK